MKGFTILVQFGWCGFGASGGLIPEVRCGLIRFACCRGWLWDVLTKMRAALVARL